MRPGGRTVLVVDDEPSIGDGLRLTLEAEGYAVRIAGSVQTALAAFAQSDIHVAIVDLMLPDGDGLALTREFKKRDRALEVIVVTAYGSVRKAMEATKGAGAFYVLEKPFEPDEVLALVGNALEHRKLIAENTDLKRRLGEQVADSEVLGAAPSMQRVMETVARVADADASVLIVGESGTGKELIANALHERSRRREGPWVKINCAALPKDLIESELFGHTKGSFTGATTEKAGLLEEAHRGSLLLDEITEMPIDLQAKLLRVLEERVVRRLGGTKSVPVDFRLVSSTNRHAEAAVKDGRLRQDLYFRINTVTIQIPPLRERREDRGRGTCASCSTRSSAPCSCRGHVRSWSPTCPRRCSKARERSGRAWRLPMFPRARSRRSSGRRSSRRWSRRDGTSRRRRRCSVCDARRCTPRCGSTTSPSGRGSGGDKLRLASFSLVGDPHVPGVRSGRLLGRASPCSLLPAATRPLSARLSMKFGQRPERLLVP